MGYASQVAAMARRVKTDALADIAIIEQQAIKAACNVHHRDALIEYDSRQRRCSNTNERRR